MISPKEVRQKAERWYREVMQSAISGIDVFPKEIAQIGAFRQEDAINNLADISSRFEALIGESKDKKGYGYSLEWEERNFRSIGKNRFIRRISFDSLSDYLDFIGKNNEFELFKINSEKLVTAFPELKDWAMQNPLRIVEYEKDWTDIILVLTYFKNDHLPGKFFIRELPIRVHTKFIEDHKGVLYDLINIVIPPHLINNECKGLKDFEKRFGLKFNDPLIRVRILDSKIAEKYFSGLTDISIPESEFNQLKLECKRVFIFENKTNFSNILNFLTLPQLKDSIAIFGSGFKVGLLKNSFWLKEKELFYWGDLDVQGFQILSQLRECFSEVNSFLMDRKTFDAFPEYHVTGAMTIVKDPENLREEELLLYRFLKNNNLRLEQEKIMHWYVMEEMKDLD